MEGPNPNLLSSEASLIILGMGSPCNLRAISSGLTGFPLPLAWSTHRWLYSCLAAIAYSSINSHWAGIMWSVAVPQNRNASNGNSCSMEHSHDFHCHRIHLGCHLRTWLPWYHHYLTDPAYWRAFCLVLDDALLMWGKSSPTLRATCGGTSAFLKRTSTLSPESPRNCRSEYAVRYTVPMHQFSNGLWRMWPNMGPCWPWAKNVKPWFSMNHEHIIVLGCLKLC